MKFKSWVSVILCLGLSACMTVPKMPTDMVLPQEAALQAASAAAGEQWYQAEWFWQGHSIAFLMMLRSNGDGSHTLVATTLTGQELFAVQERQQQFTVLQQLPETKRIPLPYVYRDVVWASASAAAFARMQQPAHQFQADANHKTWSQGEHTLWQASLQNDQTWLIDNASAHYQMRLSPIANDETEHNENEVQP